MRGRPSVRSMWCLTTGRRGRRKRRALCQGKSKGRVTFVRNRAWSLSNLLGFRELGSNRGNRWSSRRRAIFELGQNCSTDFGATRMVGAPETKTLRFRPGFR